MWTYMTFAEFLQQRDFLTTTSGTSPTGDAGRTPTACQDRQARAAEDGVIQVAERSSFRNPFKGIFKAIKPARPVSPTNSRLFGPVARGVSGPRSWAGERVVGRRVDREWCFN